MPLTVLTDARGTHHAHPLTCTISSSRAVCVPRPHCRCSCCKMSSGTSTDDEIHTCSPRQLCLCGVLSVWVCHPQSPPSPGSATPRIPILLGLRSNFGGVSTNSTIPTPTARHVSILGRSTRWHSCEDCKVIEPTQYALKRVRFFSFQVLHKTIELIK